MKKHELLKHAYDNYPKGTKFKNLFTKEIHTSTGKFKLTDISICEEESSIMLMQHSHGIWAEIVSDRKPLLISEDGVPLYEGDSCYVAVFKCNKWFLDDHIDGGDSEMFEVTNNGKFINSDTEKHFSTKQAALEWIESQKPKYPIINETKKEVVTEIEIEFNEESSVLITKDNIHFSGKDFKLTQLEVMDVFFKFNSLQNA